MSFLLVSCFFPRSIEQRKWGALNPSSHKAKLPICSVFVMIVNKLTKTQPTLKLLLICSYTIRHVFIYLQNKFLSRFVWKARKNCYIWEILSCKETIDWSWLHYEIFLTLLFSNVGKILTKLYIWVNKMAHAEISAEFLSSFWHL